MRPPTDKQLAFAREYTRDHNAKQAAIRAGYIANSAAVTGCRLLINANIKNEIQRIERLKSKSEAFSRAIAEAEYEEARALARSLLEPGSMVSATKGKAKLYGLDITSIEVSSGAGRRPPDAEQAIARSKDRVKALIEGSTDKDKDDT